MKKYYGGFFIVAVDEKWGIAKDNTIPWHYKEDFKFFKKMTEGFACVLGYNTYAEIAKMRGYPEKTDQLLPNRICKVITSRDIPTSQFVKRTTIDGVVSSENIHAFIGGVLIYNYAMEDFWGACEYGYITRIKHDHDCDTFFNNELLEEGFKLGEVIEETEDLRFEKWIRK
jgi:dihydrofolate reductase